MNVFLLLGEFMDWLSDPLVHILLGVLVGFLVAWLILTISYALIWALRRGFQVKVSSAVVYGIIISSLLLGISAALVSHALLDHILYLWDMPLAPSLDLVIP